MRSSLLVFFFLLPLRGFALSLAAQTLLALEGCNPGVLGALVFMDSTEGVTIHGYLVAMRALSAILSDGTVMCPRLHPSFTHLAGRWACLKEKGVVEGCMR
jgi:hypothetical protein